MPLHCQRNGPTGSSLDRPGARRAVTCATITSNKGLGVVASRNPSILHLKESRWRLRIVEEVVEACQCPIGECTGKFGLLTVDYYVDPAKRRYGCSLYLDENTTTTSHPLFQSTLQHHTLWRWQLLHPRRNGSLTSIHLLLQSQSRQGFPTLPDSRPP